MSINGPSVIEETDESSNMKFENEILENYFKVRSINFKRFRQDFPFMKNLTNRQVFAIFKLYKENLNRYNDNSNVSFLVAGTLIILLTSIFVNSGAPMEISTNNLKPNKIVMNTIISSASAGLC